MKPAVYSLLAIDVVINHPSYGQHELSRQENGGGQISIAYNTDLANHTTTASGYVVVNKLNGHAGSIQIEVAQNSPNDLWLRGFCNWLDSSCPIANFADATITVKDNATGKMYTGTGVTPVKRPDRTMGEQAATMTCSFLCAYIVEN